MFPQQEPKLIEMQSFLANNVTDRKWLKEELILIAKDKHNLIEKVTKMFDTSLKNQISLYGHQKVIKLNLEKLALQQQVLLKNQENCNNDVEEIKLTTAITMETLNASDKNSKQILEILLNGPANEFAGKVQVNFQEDVQKYIAQQAPEGIQSDVREAEEDPMKSSQKVLSQVENYKQKVVSQYAEDEMLQNDGSIFLFPTHTLSDNE